MCKENAIVKHNIFYQIFLLYYSTIVVRYISQLQNIMMLRFVKK